MPVLAATHGISQLTSMSGRLLSPPLGTSIKVGSVIAAAVCQIVAITVLGVRPCAVLESLVSRSRCALAGKAGATGDRRVQNSPSQLHGSLRREVEPNRTVVFCPYPYGKG